MAELQRLADCGEFGTHLPTMTQPYWQPMSSLADATSMYMTSLQLSVFQAQAESKESKQSLRTEKSK